MRQVVLRVPLAALDDVLDRVLPLVPGGVRELPVDRRQVELRMRGDDLPALAELARAVRPWPHKLSEDRVSDDWHERRLADYRTEPIAGRLGWEPVTALDILPSSVESAAANAARNGVSIEARLTDLFQESPPAADGFAANVPAAVHLMIAAGWERAAPATGLLSGFGPDQAQTVIDAYSTCGLHERRRLERFGWVIAEIGQD
jgi:Ribosomal protein L11 methyltransferase (PrmA)